MLRKAWCVLIVLGTQLHCLTGQTIHYNDENISYPNSVIEMVKLMQIEKLMMGNLSAYIELLEEKIDILSLALEEMHAIHEKADDDTETFLSNPLNVFSLTRRMHSDWHNWHKYLQAPMGEAQIKSLHELDPDMPTERDYEESSAGMRKIQETHNLKTKDMAAGLLAGAQYDAKMSSMDCFCLGSHFFHIKSLETKDHRLAYEWLVMALHTYRHTDEKIYAVMGYDLGKIWHRIAEYQFAEENYEEALHAINTALSYKPDEELYKAYKLYVAEFIQHSKTCRGEFKKISQLNCFYQSSTLPYSSWASFKVEQVQSDPVIVMYHDVIYASEIRELKSLAAPKLSQSYTDANRLQAASIRSVESTAVGRLQRRIKQLVGNEFATHATEMHVLNYGVGGDYYNHLDRFNETVVSMASKGPKHINFSIFQQAERQSATILFYLNDIELGGATAFPLLEKAIQPKKGAALLWRHQNNNGYSDRRALHAGCPVLIGSKWVAAQIFDI